MRNGNLYIVSSSSKDILVLTVPMRNGNTKESREAREGHKSSYRTYEEWKLPSIVQKAFRLHSSYRTYEEWKLPIRLKQNSPRKGSYRTYEEWKHEYGLSDEVVLEMVLTVPMRNGNSSHRPISHVWPRRSYRTYEEWKPYFHRRMINNITFLPYLWGMETLVT